LRNVIVERVSIAKRRLSLESPDAVSDTLRKKFAFWSSPTRVSSIQLTEDSDSDTVPVPTTITAQTHSNSDVSAAPTSESVAVFPPPPTPSQSPFLAARFVSPVALAEQSAPLLPPFEFAGSAAMDQMLLGNRLPPTSLLSSSRTPRVQLRRSRLRASVSTSMIQDWVAAPADGGFFTGTASATDASLCHTNCIELESGAPASADNVALLRSVERLMFSPLSVPPTSSAADSTGSAPAAVSPAVAEVHDSAMTLECARMSL